MSTPLAKDTAFAARFRAQLETLRERTPSRVEPELLPAHFRQASVLMLFWADGDRIRVLMTLRPTTLKSHGGQISFPGGRLDPEDVDLRHTALRETFEEVGIPPEQIQVIAPFDDAWSVQGYAVSAWVGWLDTPPELVANPDEIERIIVADVQELLDPAIHRIQRMTRHGVTYPIHFFDYRGDIIWGMTAGLLHGFLSWLQGLPISPEHDGRAMLLRYLQHQDGAAR